MASESLAGFSTSAAVRVPDSDGIGYLPNRASLSVHPFVLFFLPLLSSPLGFKLGRRPPAVAWPEVPGNA